MTLDPPCPETLEEMTCPKCERDGICDVSTDAYFVQDKLALRCRTCRHVWPVDLSVKFIRTYQERMQAVANKGLASGNPRNWEKTP